MAVIYCLHRRLRSVCEICSSTFVSVAVATAAVRRFFRVSITAAASQSDLDAGLPRL